VNTKMQPVYNRQYFSFVYLVYPVLIASTKTENSECASTFHTLSGQYKFELH